MYWMSTAYVEIIQHPFYAAVVYSKAYVTLTANHLKYLRRRIGANP
jgi:hypothetical protein